MMYQKEKKKKKTGENIKQFSDIFSFILDFVFIYILLTVMNFLLN